GYSIYLLGASPGIAQEASLKLLKKYPGLKIAGHHHGYFNAESLEHSDNLKNSEVSDNNSNISNNNSSSSIQKTKETNINCNQEKEEAEIIQEIKDKKPDILLVGMGVPRQEKWISRNLESKQLNVPVCMGVGGSFDVLSGKISRAPFWMQKHGMEWIYRLIKQPKRAFHTLALFYFMGLVIAGKIILTLKNTD
ncbi:MAG: WecB/TagA/CpsF family glycosyltransferase, partial [Candidatus Caldatribacteriota bacterium]|nr:WecB/TagA/CpsF family glycosyltransferase [Candidatus Caldatribacteriota bacterium]